LYFWELKIETHHRNVLPVFVYKKTPQNPSSLGYTSAWFSLNYLPWLLE